MTLPNRDDAQRWRVASSQRVYTSPWVEVYVDDVELPSGAHIDHHVIKFPRASVGTVAIDAHDRVLLIWRHRYITDTWGWEIPAGWGDPGEDPADAARRELEEETGFRAGSIDLMTTYKPLAGISTMHYSTFVATDVEQVSAPVDRAETTGVRWFPAADLPGLADAGRITDGPSLTALTYYLGVYRPLHDH
jgi:8-oxo-dGTP pyrophosphatase MutT (NUDIX family)